jgi:hypothetical protein
MVGAHLVKRPDGAPTNQPLGIVCGGIIGVDIPSTTGLDFIRYTSAADTLERLHDLKYAASSAPPQIYDEALRAIQQVERGDMTGSEIHDVDVVPDPSSVT